MIKDTEVTKVKVTRRPMPQRVTFKTVTWVSSFGQSPRRRKAKTLGQVKITNTKR